MTSTVHRENITYLLIEHIWNMADGVMFPDNHRPFIMKMCVDRGNWIVGVKGQHCSIEEGLSLWEYRLILLFKKHTHTHILANVGTQIICWSCCDGEFNVRNMIFVNVNNPSEEKCLSQILFKLIWKCSKKRIIRTTLNRLRSAVNGELALNTV